MNKLRWGILGPGIIAREFAADFEHVTNAEIMAVASRSRSRAEEFGQTFGIPKVYGSYQEIYMDPNIDAIYIATPHVFHKEQSILALRAGKSVLCEKPITISQAELKELLKVAGESKGYLVEGMWTYFLPAIKKARKWIEEGRIGRVLHLKSEFGYKVPFDPDGRMFNPKLAGGALWDMGIYNIAMVHYFIDEPIDHIQVIAEPSATGVDEDVVMHFFFNQTMAHLHTSFRCKLQNYTMVIGENGYITIPDFWRARSCSLYAGEEQLEHFEDRRLGHGFEFEIEAISADILRGRRSSEIVNHKTSLQFQKIMDEVRGKMSFVRGVT